MVSQLTVSRIMVALLALAHDSGQEAAIAAALDKGRLPDVADLRDRFGPKPAPMPQIHIEMPRASIYDVLIVKAGAGIEQGAVP